MKRTAFKVNVRAILAVILIIALAISLSSCAGGEIGFSGRVISSGTYNDRYFVTAEVTSQADVSFLQKKLPDVIIFYANDYLIDHGEEFEPGDYFDGCYLAGTIHGNSVRVVAISPSNRADNPEGEYSPDSRIEFVAAVTAPDKIERHALDPNADEIEVAYIPWPGRKDVPGPISSGSFINADFVNDYIDVSALADAALPVYRVAALPGADEAATAGYGKLLEWLRQEAYDFLGATDTAMTGLTESYSVPKAAYDEPAFRLDKARTRVSARPAEYQFEKRLDGACAADEDGILDLLKNDDFYAAAAKYLGITDPTVMSRTYCGNDGEISYREFLIYEASDDPVMTIYNASFRSVRLWPRGGVSGGDMINCTFNKPSAIVYAGDCTLRPYEDAVSEAVSVYGIAADDILAHDVGYYDDITPGYFIPCYRFLVDTHGQFFASAPDAPEPEIMECIDIIVPAVVL